MPWPEEIPGAVMAGRYRLLRALDGEGGRLYEARHDRLAGRFAVKLFPDAEPGEFRRRAQLALSLRHPGIAQVLDYGPAPDAGGAQCFVVMEWLDGRPLSALIQESGLLALEQVVRLVGGVAQGLTAAHALQVVHGDLGPDRILVVAGGTGAEAAKVIGFGLGGAVSRAPELREVTPYTAPEQLAADADERSDQFALGAVAYEMLAGVPPFDDADDDADDGDRKEAPSIRDYVPDVNVIVDDVIRKALTLDPDGRWRDVKMFADRLREASLAGELDEKTRIAAPAFLDAQEPATPTPVDVLVDVSETPTARALVPVSGLDFDLDDLDIDAPLPPRRGLLPPPSGSHRLELATHPVPATAGAPWAEAPVQTLVMPAARGGRTALRAVALLATAGLVAFAGVKFDIWRVAREMTARFSDGKTPAAAPPAPTPARPGGPAPAPTPPAVVEIAPAPHDVPVEGSESQAAVRPEVVPLPAAAPAPPPVAPAIRHRSHRHHGGGAGPAPLPPELAAEEALLGGPSPAPKVADKRRTRSAPPQPEAARD